NVTKSDADLVRVLLQREQLGLTLHPDAETIEQRFQDRLGSTLLEGERERIRRVHVTARRAPPERSAVTVLVVREGRAAIGPYLVDDAEVVEDLEGAGVDARRSAVRIDLRAFVDDAYGRPMPCQLAGHGEPAGAGADDDDRVRAHHITTPP